MKKAFSILLALSLVLSCAFALAEENETCTYTVFNETGPVKKVKTTPVKKA